MSRVRIPRVLRKRVHGGLLALLVPANKFDSASAASAIGSVEQLRALHAGGVKIAPHRFTWLDFAPRVR